MFLKVKILKNPQNSCLELFNEFSKVTVYKINIQKSIAYLSNNNE